MKLSKKWCDLHLTGASQRAYEGERIGTINGHKYSEQALGSANFGIVDVEVADSATRNALLLRLASVDHGQAANALTFQTTTQREPGQEQDRRLQTVEAVVERRQGGAPKSDDDRLLFVVSTIERGSLGPIRESAVAACLRHLCTIVGLTP